MQAPEWVSRFNQANRRKLDPSLTPQERAQASAEAARILAVDVPAHEADRKRGVNTGDHQEYQDIPTEHLYPAAEPTLFEQPEESTPAPIQEPRVTTPSPYDPEELREHRERGEVVEMRFNDYTPDPEESEDADDEQ